MTDSITYKIADNVATITLDQAKRANPIDAAFATSLAKALDAIDADDSVRAILIRAEGKNFSFGGDLTAFLAGESIRANLEGIFEPFNPALARLWGYGVPVVVAVQGFAVGGGLGIACNADVIVAGENTKFGAAFAGIGGVNDSGSTWGMAARVGIAKARKFFLLNETWTAQQALENGLADIVVADDEIAETAEKLVAKLAAGPTLSYRGIKDAFRQMSARTLADSAQTEADNFLTCADGTDLNEGINALLEKRKPSFIGR
jgi:2-(1,2-epoxy-1,2-dihydrophenyl)acetyl-CoA isomerase